MLAIADKERTFDQVTDEINLCSGQYNEEFRRKSFPSSSGADTYILFCGPTSVSAFVLSQTQFQGEISARLGTDLYFTEIYKRTVLISECSGFFLEGACMYGLLRLSSFELILNQS